MSGVLRHSRLVTVVAALVIAASATFGQSGPVDAGSGHRFLTLPFPRQRDLRIFDGWLRGENDLHRGIDYIRGKVRDPGTWQSFAVIAAADGKACAARNYEDGCINGVGNRVVIKHRHNGRTYYTYYGHLRRVVGIPMGLDRYSVKVKRGQLIGFAGRSGYPGTGLHLHFELETAPGAWLDPYDLYDYREAYPNPTYAKGKGCGPHRYWVRCPPKPPPDADDPWGPNSSD